MLLLCVFTNNGLAREQDGSTAAERSQHGAHPTRQVQPPAARSGAIFPSQAGTVTLRARERKIERER